MKELAHFIEIVANAFLRREFITILPFLLGLATILHFAMPVGADLVGNNEGDCYGSSADLFESGADNVVTTMIVAASPIFLQNMCFPP